MTQTVIQRELCRGGGGGGEGMAALRPTKTVLAVQLAPPIPGWGGSALSLP